MGKSRGHLNCIVFLSALGSILAFRFSVDSLVLGSGVGVGTLLCALIGLHGWRKSLGGHLSWQGQQWHWSEWGDMPVTSLAVLLDFQGLTLIVVRNSAAQQMWLWLEPLPGDSNWIKLRRALMLTSPLESRQTATI